MVVLHGLFGVLGLVLDVLGGGGAFLFDGGRRRGRRVLHCLGSLLRGLVDGDSRLLAGLEAVGNGRATLDVVLNGGALAEVGWPLTPGGERTAATLRRIGAT